MTATGVVEPMRTHDGNQQRGLARHVLTTGIDLLAGAGAKRISIGYEPDNPASGHLYRSVGFEPHMQTDVFSGRASARVSSAHPPRFRTGVAVDCRLFRQTMLDKFTPFLYLDPQFNRSGDVPELSRSANQRRQRLTLLVPRG